MIKILIRQLQVMMYNYQRLQGTQEDNRKSAVASCISRKEWAGKCVLYELYCLPYAARSGDLGRIKDYVEHKVNINQKDEVVIRPYITANQAGIMIVLNFY